MSCEVAILPFEIQQWLRSSRLLQVQRFHFTNHDQVITGDVFGVDLAIEPVQAAGNQRVTQRRRLPFDAVPFVRTFTGELIGNADLFARQDVDRESTGLADFRVAGRTGHHAE